MDEIKNIVNKVFANIPGSTAPKKQEDIGKAWEKILKQYGLTQAKIVGLKDGTLIVSVDSPARLYLFNLKKKKITEQMNREVPEIKKIYFKIG